jgi:ubiquinone/menaquinone biosynthesis C-methylase UbiE
MVNVVIDNFVRRIVGTILGALTTSVSNKHTWESEDIVKAYTDHFYLWKPEETILSDLKSQLQNMKMLDIGVGAGRTTHYFAHLTKEYVGIDYSKNMIKLCRERFQKNPKKISFEVQNAKDLKFFEERYFNFVLFSFNGLDYMNHIDRLKAFREIHSVSKNGGYFCFSTHNLNSARWLFSVRLSKNPVKLLREMPRLFLMRLFNRNEWNELRNELRNKKYAIFNNGGHDFRLRSYYIRPKDQVEQLIDSGFNDVKIYGLSDGKEIKDLFKEQNTTDAWLYYLCKVR